MDALDLSPSGYTGTYKLIGGRLCLDFINTVSWPRVERRHDWLSSVANIRRWADAVGLDARGIRLAEVDQIRATRSLLASLIHPIAHELHPPQSAVDDFNDVLSLTNGRRCLESTTLTWSWRHQTPLELLIDPIIDDAAELARLQDRSRLRHCPSCDWLFVDETRNGRRRWCDMADCGSRSKSRRYYERRTE